MMQINIFFFTHVIEFSNNNFVLLNHILIVYISNTKFGFLNGTYTFNQISGSACYMRVTCREFINIHVIKFRNLILIISEIRVKCDVGKKWIFLQNRYLNVTKTKCITIYQKSIIKHKLLWEVFITNLYKSCEQ